METVRAPSGTRVMPSSPKSRQSAFGGFPVSSQYSNDQDGLGISRELSHSPTAGRKFQEPIWHPASDLDAIIDRSDTSSPPASALLLRRLSVSMSQEALNSMLIFASDLIDADFLGQPRYSDDHGYQTAVARFATVEGALEVRNRLHGKPNPSGNSAMIIEVIRGPNPPMTNGIQRSRSDAQAARLSTSASSTGSSHGRPSRYSNQFQAMDQATSPTRASRVPGALDLSNTDAPATSHIQNLFSPRSPIKSSTDGNRLSSRAILGDETPDEETRELLQNPVAFAEGSHRARNMSHPLDASFNGLRLDTSTEDGYAGSNGHPMRSPTSIGGFSSGRSGPHAMQSPNTDYSSNYNFSPTSPLESFSPQYPRHQLPPANPADQNPPCNTLYVGNLPINTSEEELKTVFTKQRGYKRLCFRTKHNGPMCFVEFEDVSFATKALKELYGHPLHNSVKGGIRLSFSKNPLGVRKDQMNMHSPMSSMGNGFGGFGGGFSTAAGPPPGLAYPPGLSGGMPTGNSMRHDSFFTSAGSPPHFGGLGNHGDMFQNQLGNAYMSNGHRFHPIGHEFADPASRR